MSDNRNLLQQPPKKARGVRRLNSYPAWIAVGLLAVAGAATGWNYMERTARQQKIAETTSKDPLPSDGASLDGLIRDNNVRQVIFKPPQPPPASTLAMQKAAEAKPTASQPVTDAAEQARRQAWMAYYANEAQIEQARFTAEKTGLTADTALASGQTGDSAAPAGTSGITATMPQTASLSTLMPPTGYGTPLPAGIPGDAPGGFGYPAALPDISGARDKQAFMAQAGDTSGAGDTLMATVRDPVSPYLITAGDFINCVSMGGENSDAPGMFVGRVTQNVYDTATGRYLLIPQGAKVVGVYDNTVSAGQTRIPTAITRIIFPDSESLDLGSMPAADQSGFAGLHDQVNTHWWAKFGNALILGIAGAGVQLSQGTGYNGNGYNAQQIAAASLGQQFAELGAETARSGLTIPNTIEVRPGYRFTILVTKDIVLRPYVDQRSTGASISLGPVLQ